MRCDLALPRDLAAMADSSDGRKRKSSWDSPLSQEKRSRLPLGPRTLEEVFDWPTMNAKSLRDADPEAFCRLQAMFARGLSVVSDYSGYFSEMEALVRSWAGVQKLVNDGEDQDKLECPFEFRRACDCREGPQEVLIEISKQICGGRMCVFQNLMDRLHPTARKHMLAVAPSKGASPAMAKNEYKKSFEWLVANRGWALPAGLMTKCLVHNQYCAAYPETTEDDQGLSKVRISVAGVTCNGWSAMGGGLKYAHESELIHNIYTCERMVRAESKHEDIAFTECTIQYPTSEKLATPLHQHHVVVWTTTGPEKLGQPCHRLRMLSASICKERYVWVGPEPQRPTEIAKAFGAVYNKSSEIGGAALLCGDEYFRMQMYVRMARVQKNYASAAQLAMLPTMQLMQTILAPWQLQNFQEWHAIWNKMSPPERRLGLIVDLDQNTDWARMGGSLWPVHLSHGVICAWVEGSAPQVGHWAGALHSPWLPQHARDHDHAQAISLDPNLASYWRHEAEGTCRPRDEYPDYVCVDDVGVRQHSATSEDGECSHHARYHIQR